MAKVNCDQCSASMINGVFCHETGCPNQKKRYDAEEDCWIAQYNCLECGNMCDEGTNCCGANYLYDDDEDTPDEDAHWG
jgi:hypothetical protein